LFFYRKRERPEIFWWRQVTVGLLILASLGILSGLVQPAAARPLKANGGVLVLINEVAWGGTNANPSHQWVELFNPDKLANADLSGWTLTLKQASNNINIDLNGYSLPAEGYLLIESSPGELTGLPVGEVEIVDPRLYLDIRSTQIQLSDGIGLVDTANLNGSSMLADNSQPNSCSMERVPDQPDSEIAWVTHAGNSSVNDAQGNPVCGTPGSKNIISALTPTPPSTLTSTATATPYLQSTLIINEVGWMGTQADPGAQWIELYNPGVMAIDLTGWILSSRTTSFNINLPSESVPGHAYYLLARGGTIPFTDIQADFFYSNSSFSTAGQGDLQLFGSHGGNPVDTANQPGGVWPAGDAGTYCSMERAQPSLTDLPGAWFTNDGSITVAHDSQDNPICGSPRARNWANSVTATATFTATSTRTPTRTGLPTRTITPTRTPTKTPKKSPTPTRDPSIPFPSSIVINEFLPQAHFDWNGDGKVDSGDEFIEILNLSDQPISISGWRLDVKPGTVAAYTLRNVIIQAGARLAFFGSETGLFLSSGGDTIRLLKTNGQVSDAFTYDVGSAPDQSWCRLPDGGSKWVFGCTPTITETNHRTQDIVVGHRVESEIGRAHV
jgi:hypothetical protein